MGKENWREELLEKILNKDIWEQNSKMKIKIYVRVEIEKALDEAYFQGFEKSGKVITEIISGSQPKKENL